MANNFNDLPDRTFLTPDEVARFFRVTIRTVYNWCDEGQFRVCKLPGRAIRIYRDSVEEAMKERERQFIS